MWIRNLFDSLKPRRLHTPLEKARPKAARRRLTACRPAVETLEDRSVPASLSISDAVVMEGVAGTHNAELKVLLSAPSNKTVRVDYRASSTFAVWPKATAGSDYEAVFGRLTFAPGEITKSILVPVYGDRTPEDDEYFDVILNHASGAGVTFPLGRVTILDSAPRIYITDYPAAWEADGFMTIEVRLTAAYDLPVTVNFATQDGYASPGYADSAVAGQDYVATSGTVTFAPGVTTMTFTVPIIAGTTPEHDEVFYVNLSGASNALIYSGWTEGLIFGELGTPPSD